MSTWKEVVLEIIDVIGGATKTIMVNKYERDRNAREKCIAIHGVTCLIYGFNFEKVYGRIGQDFIHVHHIRPLYKTGKYVVDPEKDLIPVCPNCHAMAHRYKDRIFTVAELKGIISENINKKINIVSPNSFPDIQV